MTIVRKASLAAAGLALVLLAAPPAEAQRSGRQRGALIVSGSEGLSRAYAVNNRSVIVSGNGHRIVLRGRCPSLRVGGTGNRVHADAVGVVTLSGSNNRVYWRRLYNGRRPRVERGGNNNQVLRRTRTG